VVLLLRSILAWLQLEWDSNVPSIPALRTWDVTRMLPMLMVMVMMAQVWVLWALVLVQVLVRAWTLWALVLVQVLVQALVQVWMLVMETRCKDLPL